MTDSSGDRNAPPPPLRYASESPDAPKQPKTSTLAFFSIPAIACIVLFFVMRAQIEADPLNEHAGENVYVALFLTSLVSILTSGAVILAIFETRKTFATVSILAINLGWFAIAVFMLLIYRYGR